MSLLSTFFFKLESYNNRFLSPLVMVGKIGNFRSSEEHLLESKFVLAWTRS